MLDTVKVQSPEISESMAREIGHAVDRRMGVRGGTGELFYDIYRGQVRDDDGRGVNVQVMRTKVIGINELRWKRIGADGVYHTLEVLQEHGRSVTVKCPPYLYVEGSVHKNLLGHNVCGGPKDLGASVRWLVTEVARRMGVELPVAESWDVMRADWAHTYELAGPDHVQDYVRSLASVRFPRRQPQRFGDHSILYPGSTSSLRIYHKGPEFFSNGFKPLLGVYPPEELQWLSELANRTLRVECSVKRPKIVEYHGDNTTIENVMSDFLEQTHNREVKKVIREAESGMTIVRDHHSVLRRLHTLYPGRERLVASLFSTWIQIQGLGENVVKDGMKHRSYYRHRKQLLDAGCALTRGDVLLGEMSSDLPEDFLPVSSDVRCTSSEAPEVSEKLEEHRIVAA